MNEFQIRPPVQSDRLIIENQLRESGFFLEEEIKVALELYDTAINNPYQKDYYFGIAESWNTVLGFICYGPAPMTAATFDIYWICVDPKRKNSGIGKKLMEWGEQEIRKKGGKIIIVETSGKPLYEPTRGFYKHLGYVEEARIKDYYRQGDDRVIFIKRL